MTTDIFLFPSHRGLCIRKLKYITSAELDFYYEPLKDKLPTSRISFLLNLMRNHAVFEILSNEGYHYLVGYHMHHMGLTLVFSQCYSSVEMPKELEKSTLQHITNVLSNTQLNQAT